jgi:uncharacterized protein (TIGR02266 family)
MAEKRQAPRFEVNRVFADAGELIREYAMNVSLGGCFIRTAEVLPVGTEVSLEFTVILDDLETIEGAGEVTRVVEPGGGEPPGVGVVFTSLTPASREVLVRLFLRENRAAG